MAKAGGTKVGNIIRKITKKDKTPTTPTGGYSGLGGTPFAKPSERQSTSPTPTQQALNIKPSQPTPSSGGSGGSGTSGGGGQSIGGGATPSSTKGNLFGLSSPEENVLTKIAKTPEKRKTISSQVADKDMVKDIKLASSKDRYELERNLRGDRDEKIVPIETFIEVDTGRKGLFTLFEGGRIKKQTELFSDTSQLQQGTRTSQFAGYSERGVPLFIDSSFITVGQKQGELNFMRFGEEQKFQSEAQELFEKESTPKIDALFSIAQGRVDKGSDIEFEQKLLESQVKDMEKQFLSSPEYFDLKLKAEKSASRFGILPGVGMDIVPESKTGKILEYTPIIGSGSRAIESGMKLSESQANLMAAESLFGIGGASKEMSKEANKYALGFTADIGMVGLDTTLVGGIARHGMGVTKAALQRNLAKQTSLGMESLGKAPLLEVGMKDVGSGNFLKVFKQEAGDYSRVLFLTGKGSQKGGLNLLAEKDIYSLTAGKAELTGVKKYAGKALGIDTTEVVVQPQIFTLDTASISKKTGESFGLAGSRTSGVGVISPKFSSYAIGGESLTSKEIDKMLIENIQIGGTSIATTFEKPVFSKGIIDYSRTKTGASLDFKVNLKKYTEKQGMELMGFKGKGQPSSEKYFKDLYNPKVGGTELQLKKADIKSGKSLLMYEELQPMAKNIKQFETPELMATIKEGLSKTAYRSKPFSISKPVFPKVLKKGLLLDVGTKGLLLNDLDYKSMIKSKTLIINKLQPLQGTSLVQSLKPITVQDLSGFTFQTKVTQPVSPIGEFGESIGSFSIFPGFALPKFGTFGEKKKKKYGVKTTQTIRPSLTGIGLYEFGGITGELGKGSSPSLRFVPKEFSKKRKSKKRNVGSYTDL